MSSTQKFGGRERLGQGSTLPTKKVRKILRFQIALLSEYSQKKFQNSAATKTKSLNFWDFLQKLVRSTFFQIFWLKIFQNSDFSWWDWVWRSVFKLPKIIFCCLIEKWCNTLSVYLQDIQKEVQRACSWWQKLSGGLQPDHPRSGTHPGPVVKYLEIMESKVGSSDEFKLILW